MVGIGCARDEALRFGAVDEADGAVVAKQQCNARSLRGPRPDRTRSADRNSYTLAPPQGLNTIKAMITNTSSSEP
jgi:hypothetical protein